MTKLAHDWLPAPRILQPWPALRFAVKQPKVGAGCSNWARPDPCGGCPAMGIPSAILHPQRSLGARYGFGRYRAFRPLPEPVTGSQRVIGSSSRRQTNCGKRQTRSGIRTIDDMSRQLRRPICRARHPPVERSQRCYSSRPLGSLPWAGGSSRDRRRR